MAARTAWVSPHHPAVVGPWVARQRGGPCSTTFPASSGRATRPGQLDRVPRRRRQAPPSEVTVMSISGKVILDTIRERLNLPEYHKIHWECTFEEYLDIVIKHPEVTRTAYQRLYDMIISHGTEEVFENKEKIIRYKFFTEYAAKYDDGIFGIDRPLMQLVNTFKSAAKGYGTERRVLLLHGPVGSAKSTIARLLKRGLEDYSRTDAGML